MKDKKTITVEIPILDNVDELKVVETFTEEQLWYVCAIAKAFDKLQSNWNSLREFVEELYNKEGSWAVCGARYVLDKMNELEGKDK